MGAIGVAVSHQLAKSRLDTAAMACHRLREVAQRHFIDHADDADCPTPTSLRAAHEIDSTTTTDDPWGTAYRIECLPEEVIASSAGPDRAFGSEDDIRVPGPRRRTAPVATRP